LAALYFAFFFFLPFYAFPLLFHDDLIFTMPYAMADAIAAASAIYIYAPPRYDACLIKLSQQYICFDALVYACATVMGRHAHCFV